MSENDAMLTLPTIPDALVDRMEDEIFARIGQERTDHAAKRARTRRTRVVWSAAAAAAVVVAAIAIPTALGGSRDQTFTAADAPALAEGGEAMSEAATTDEARMSQADAASTAEQSTLASADTATSAIITTLNIELQVDDATATAADLGDYAATVDGYISSESVGTSGGPAEDSATSSAPAADFAWVTLRVPADRLDEVQDHIATAGTVVSSSVDRTDVTATKIDLQARVDSLQTSVTRLTEIMAGSGSVADLVAAESALAERQATLESYEQQLSQLTDQVAMSTVSVTLTEKTPVEADPDGFGTGVAAGWTGLVASMNAVIIALGFALPWLGVAAVIVVVVMVIRRLRRHRTASDE